MKAIFLLLLFFTSFARADEIGSQYQKQAEAGDARAQYYLADTYFSSGDRKQAALWAEKAAKGGDVDAMGLLSQILFTQGITLRLKRWRSRPPSPAASAARLCWRVLW